MSNGLPYAPVFPTPRVPTSLVLTDYAFLLALALALLIAVDPFNMLLERMAMTKHLALLVALPACLLAAVGHGLYRTGGNNVFGGPRALTGAHTTGKALFPLIGLAGFIVAGSIVARFAQGEQNSFLSAGIYMLVTVLAASMMLLCRNVTRLLKGYFVLLFIAAVVVFAGLAANYGVKQVYHELEYLFPPLAVAFALGPSRPAIRWSGVIFFLVQALLFKKNTGYLSALLVLGYLFLIALWHRWSRMEGVWRAAALHWSIIGLLALVGIIAFLFFHRSSLLPSGSPEFRLLTYERAWERFLDAPLAGTLFIAPASEEFTGFDTGVANNVLPTHSDVLDMLANGGMVAFLLWAWALVRIARLALSTVLLPEWRGDPIAPYAHALAAMSLVGVVTYTFNPLFLQSGKAFLLWANLGLLVGAALFIQRKQFGHRTAQPVSSP